VPPSPRKRGEERCGAGNGREIAQGEPPPLFSKPFMEVIALAINKGHMTARRAADLLDLSLDDLAALCATFAIEAPFDL
jgi:hypothetical protein